MTPSTRTLHVGTLTRVEGEGALHVTLKDGVLERVELNIYEPPRFSKRSCGDVPTPSRRT